MFAPESLNNGVLILILLLRAVCAESLSETQINNVLNSEVEFVDELEKYVVLQEARVAKIEKFVNRLSELSADADQHGILHPAAAFLHTKVLSRDLDDLMTFLNQNREAGWNRCTTVVEIKESLYIYVLEGWAKGGHSCWPERVSFEAVVFEVAALFLSRCLSDMEVSSRASRDLVRDQDGFTLTRSGVHKSLRRLFGTAVWQEQEWLETDRLTARFSSASFPEIGLLAAMRPCEILRVRLSLALCSRSKDRLERQALLLESLRSDLAGDPAARAMARAKRLTTAQHYDILEENDLRNAALSLHLLQQEHQISARQMADGEIPTSKIQTRMTVSDIFAVAVQLFDAEMFESSYEWFSLIPERCLDDSNKILPIAEADCTETLLATSLARSGYVQFASGNITAAILQAAEALTFEETNREALDYLKIFYSSEDYQEKPPAHTHHEL